MLRAFSRLFWKEEAPKAPFVDAALGQFEFDRGLGWKKRVVVGDREVELILGSDGEPPSGEMLQMAKSWVDGWTAQHPKIKEYICDELRDWEDEPNLPSPERLLLESINLLWTDKPRTSMLYFSCPGDDIRAWHVTFDGFDPQGFAYDD